MIKKKKINPVQGHNEMTEKMANCFRMNPFSYGPLVLIPY